MEDKSDNRLGVDTGGTFTDVVSQGADGELRVYKLLSTPQDPSVAIGEGVEELVGDGAVGEIIHGTTVATNALLEREGAEVAFVTTAGFEDLLWLRRQARPDLYALDVQVPEPLVDDRYCFGVEARLDEEGGVVEPLGDEEVDRIVGDVAEADPQAVVVALLHSYANPEHEERLAEAFRRHDRDWHVTASSEVTATLREYERSSTATINGYVGPVMERYLDRLEGRLDGVDRLEVLQSHGGRADAGHAARLPVHTVLSGPAGGVVGALRAAREVGIDQIISLDMGGTSTDVSLADGEPTLTEEATIGGLPLQVPVIDIHTVGAGGGSIADVDPGGALRVGPRSAGADPGPVAYGRGGDEPTVTDAHVVLGSLRPDQFLGGEMELDRQGARRAVGGLADELDAGIEETARGILDVADATMARAIKVISLERGHDPRDYTLVAFGGAGGLHACRLAESMDMNRVLIPKFPGLTSAVGMLRSDVRRLYSRTVMRDLEECLEGQAHRWLREVMEGLEKRARREMGDREPEFSWTVSCRYEGQSFSIPVEVDWRGTDETFSDPRADFEAEHDRLYGYRADDRGVELVDLRLEARGTTAPLGSDRGGGDEAGIDGGEALETQTIDLGQGEGPVDVVGRPDLAEGDELTGPAVVTEYSGTTLVLDGWSATVEAGHLLIERD